ncbi:MAG: RNA pseudouridine synthase [Desulfobacterales bacterium]|nr:RNA pseudouridine synthase [Desulfobacterales bacterium]
MIKKTSKKYQPQGLKIIYDDIDIIVVDKSEGLLTVATEKEKFRTAHYLLTNYIRKGCSKSKKQLYVVHRLDQATSGVLIFAKNEKSEISLKNNWKQTEKKYIAVVYGNFEAKEGNISTYLTENKAGIVYSTPDTKKGKLSTTVYKVIKETKKFSMLEINLITGRKNQIRVHLNENGHPIVGDLKYGKENESHKRLALHARSISFNHPFSGKRLYFEAELPKYFTSLIGQ